MTELQISCINKTYRLNPHEKISHVGGTLGLSKWKHTLSQAIVFIENRTYSYYVTVNGYKTEVYIAEHQGNKYLKTRADSTTADNLLSLPECS